MSARLRQRITFANVVSLLALMIAVGGGTAFGLAGKNTVTSDDIVRQNVRTGDIAPNAVTASKINNAPDPPGPLPAPDVVNADKLDSQSGEGYQLGDGASRGEGFVNISNGGVLEPAAILGGGILSFSCGPSPSLIYEDAAGSTFATDIWTADIDSLDVDNHISVTDGGSSSNLLPLNQNDGTVRFQVFSAVVDEVTFSWFFDGGGTNTCTVASSVQVNGFGDAFTPRQGADGRRAGPRPSR